MGIFNFLLDTKVRITVPLSSAVTIIGRILQIDGEAEFSFNFHFIHGDRRKLTIEATVTEELTGVTLNGSASVVKYTHPVKMKFDGPQFYKPGLKYIALVSFSGFIST